MKGVLVFLVLVALAICPYPEYDLEKRRAKRKELQKEVAKCILESDKISPELRKKMEESKDEDFRKALHLFSSKLEEADREVIRKCRRIYFSKIREMFRERMHERFSRNYTHHMPEDNEHEHYRRKRYDDGPEKSMHEGPGAHERDHLGRNEHTLEKPSASSLAPKNRNDQQGNLASTKASPSASGANTKPSVKSSLAKSSAAKSSAAKSSAAKSSAAKSSAAKSSADKSSAAKSSPAKSSAAKASAPAASSKAKASNPSSSGKKSNLQ